MESRSLLAAKTFLTHTTRPPAPSASGPGRRGSLRLDRSRWSRQRERTVTRTLPLIPAAWKQQTRLLATESVTLSLPKEGHGHTRIPQLRGGKRPTPVIGSQSVPTPTRGWRRRQTLVHLGHLRCHRASGSKKKGLCQAWLYLTVLQWSSLSCFIHVTADPKQGRWGRNALPWGGHGSRGRKGAGELGQQDHRGPRIPPAPLSARVRLGQSNSAIKSGHGTRRPRNAAATLRHRGHGRAWRVPPVGGRAVLLPAAWGKPGPPAFAPDRAGSTARRPKQRGGWTQRDMAWCPEMPPWRRPLRRTFSQ